MISYQQLSEDYPDSVKPFLDKISIPDWITEEQKEWTRDGVLIKKKFLPDQIVEAYYNFRSKVNLDGGWKDPCPYMRHDELKEICLYEPLVSKMEEIIGEPMGLHLNLTGWVSTQRAWHSDDYLNPEYVYSHYVAVWIALEDINPNSGPFQYVPGSHLWAPLRRHKLFSMIPAEQSSRGDWPSTTENIIATACEQEIKDRGAEIVTYLPKKGDVLFWHGRLIHRGSLPSVPGTPRRSLIAHYSSLNHRTDMQERRVYGPTGKMYFHFPQYLTEPV